MARIATRKFAVLGFLFLIGMTGPVVTFANEMFGEGHGQTEEEAKKAALADLSATIQTEVRSEFSSIQTTGETRPYAERVIQTRSDLPILGSRIEMMPGPKEKVAMARISSEYSLDLYNTQLSIIRKKVSDSRRALASVHDNGRKYQIMTELLTQVDQYYKYKLVAALLGNKTVPDLPVSEADIKIRLAALEKKADSLDLVAQLVVREIKGRGENRFYVYAPIAAESSEVTQLAGAIRDRIAGELVTTAKSAEADVVLEGQYEVLNDSIELVYRVKDRNHNTLSSHIVRLSPAAYEGYEYRPRAVNFSRLLKSGVIVSGDFRVDLQTDSGKKGIFYRDGEKGQIFFKMNRQGYFYIVGHVVKDGEKHSYLLELQNADGNRRFVSFVNADDANRWIRLGEFEVVPPLGTESLQIMASDQDLVQKVPANKYDPRSKLFLVDKDPSSGVKKTRAIVLTSMKKEIGKKKPRYAEAVLEFTTLPAKKEDKQ